MGVYTDKKKLSIITELKIILIDLPIKINNNLILLILSYKAMYF